MALDSGNGGVVGAVVVEEPELGVCEVTGGELSLPVGPLGPAEELGLVVGKGTEVSVLGSPVDNDPEGVDVVGTVALG